MADWAGITYGFLPTPSARRATACRPITRPLPCGFLPTPSAWRATGLLQALRMRDPISTHALREEGDNCADCQVIHPAISTHALREEGDVTTKQARAMMLEISTHALREEGDSKCAGK